MKVMRTSAVGVACAAVLIGATVAGCGGDDKGSSSSSTSSSAASSSTSAASPTSSAAAAPTESGLAQPADYSNLVIKPEDIGPDFQPVGGPPQQNPGGVPGVGQVYANPDGSRKVSITIVVYNDPNAASQAAAGYGSSFPKYVDAPPQPADVGTNGLIAQGKSPDGSKAVTLVSFASGKGDVDMEFDSALNDPATQDMVLSIARKQADAIKNGLPS
jgi:hypothetical protein